MRGMCLKNGKVTVGRGAHCLPAAAQMFVRPLFTSVLIKKGQSFLVQLAAFGKMLKNVLRLSPHQDF